ncbi:RecE-like exonuclease [Gordonia phage Dexdert]|uniref:RecE-like exonuclease n=1 Tax=Gordonia phage Dexdert TaxID=2794946 RepID=A0A7T1KS95_9CAUD|nr:RecE-like recombination exonuclease [Gordonia phage Dexdert]QPO17043.1 RecE-like exonuclease [Gordonia phage Dexdert]
MTRIVNPFADTTRLLPAFDLDTLDGRISWLKQRREGIGSSDCSAVLGMNRWADATPWHVFMDKTGQLPLDDGRDSEQMEIGREVESAIVRIVARRLGVDHYGLPALANLDRPWQRSNVDRVFVTDDGPIPFEAKNTSEYLLSEWTDGQVPDHAELQILHTLDVTGAPYGYVGGMIGGRTVVFKRIDRDPDLLEHIRTVEGELWSRVSAYLLEASNMALSVDELEEISRKYEPALTSRDTVDSIVGASPARDVDMIVVDDETAAKAREWMTQYADAQLLEKQAADMKAEARNNLVRIADGHAVIAEQVETITHPDMDLDDYQHQADQPDHKVIARVQRGVFAKARFIEAHPEVADVTMKKIEVLDTDALKREHPDLYRQFQSRSVRGPRKGDPK